MTCIPANHPFTRLFCEGCGTFHVVPKYCRNRFCELCGRPRRNKIKKRLDGYFKREHIYPYDLKMITLTIKNQSELKPMMDELKEYFKRFRRQACWLSRVSGGAYVYEITGNIGDWHCHIHCLCQCVFWLKSELGASWAEVSGSSIVWISDATKSPGGYLTKYLAKYDSDCKVKEHLLYMSDALKDYRLYQPFGTWFNNLPKLPKKPFPCKNCGSTDAWNTM